MEFKKHTIYEIIESKPSILKTNVDLYNLFTYGLYYIIGSFLILKDFFKNLLKKDIKNIKEYEIEGTDNINIQEPDVIKSEIKFFYNDDAYNLVKKLIEEGYRVNYEKLSLDFSVKRTISYYDKKKYIKNEKEVILTYPSLAQKIADKLNLNK